MGNDNGLRFTLAMKNELLSEMILKNARQKDISLLADVTEGAVSIMLAGTKPCSARVWEAICKLAPKFSAKYQKHAPVKLS